VRRSWSLLLVVVALAIAVAATSAVAVASGQLPCALVSTQPACEVALVPGPAEDTIGLVTIDGARTFPASGELLLTTVAVREDLDLGTWWEARRSAEAEVVPRETVYPPELDVEETAEQNAILMDDSQATAALAALDSAGYDVAEAASGAIVADVEPDAVTDEMVVGDTITAIDDVEIRDAEGLVAEVQAASPGDSATFTVVDAEGATRDVAVTYGANPVDADRAYVGVLLRTALDLPVEVTIDAGVIGGPSAGLMFTLGVLELLGEDDLTGGRVVAGTGTITVDGEVGPVGGVRQKVVAASTRRGAAEAASVFLVPRANLAEARRAPLGNDLLVVPVDDLDDALAALETVRDGGTPTEAYALEATR
jgi:Lon-like protease